MAKNIVIIVLALAILGGAAYLIKVSQPRVAIATLNSQNNSGQAGTATVINLPDGKTKVTLTLFGVTAGVSQPAHIHEGTCENLGNVKYPLINLLNGESSTVLDTDVGRLGRQLPLAINVHKSEREQNVYTACGNLQIP
jgi:hypothetical protein